MKDNLEKIRLSYDFFQQKADENIPFIGKDIVNFTGWSDSTVKTYLSKKWPSFLIKKDKSYYVEKKLFSYSEDEYIRMMSQVQKKSSNPYKPELSDNVERLVNKARESALLAVDVYNRPMTVFRSQGYIVLMIIAWTSLNHAIFESESLEYYYYDKDGSVQIVDGDKKAWELGQCINENSSLSQAVKENLKFFISIRNKIEHRYVPIIDLDICGECQSMLLNFEKLITEKFGNYYSLNTALAIPLQMLTTKNEWQVDVSKQLQSSHYKELKKFIDLYRKDLPKNIINDMDFSFRVYLIPKTGNHLKSSDLAIEFVKYDPENPDFFSNIEKDVALIKEKRVQVANQGLFKPKQVSEEVAAKINKKFTVNAHVKAWKYYDVRKQGNQADGCNTKYCQFDEPHGDYIYTQEWIDFLILKLSNEEEYNKVLKS